MSQDGGEDYSSMTADILLKKMKEDKTVVGITSATPTVFGFTEDKRKEAGSQFVDVGIAEETAVVASGIAKNGGKPVYGVLQHIYSTTYLRPAFTGFNIQQQSQQPLYIGRLFTV